MTPPKGIPYCAEHGKDCPHTYTPGPWKIDEAEELPLAVIRDDEDGVGICEIGARTAENEANARLIAAAPDLHVALRQLVLNTEATPFLARSLDKARAALAKAEGRTP